MITPTVGRIVLYRPYVTGAHTLGMPDHDRNLARDGDEPLPAIVTMVHEKEDDDDSDEHTINVTVFDTMGGTHGRQKVRLIQDGDDEPDDQPYCEWMEYQKGQAAKYDQHTTQTARERDQAEAKRLAQAGEPLIDIHKARA